MGRGHRELVQPGDVEAGPIGRGWPHGATIRILSEDDETGAVSALVELPAGYRRGAGHFGARSELLVATGALRVGDALRGEGYYELDPPGTTQEAWVVEADTELFLKVEGPPEFVPGPGPGSRDGRIRLDTEQMPWTTTPIPGPPDGLLLKLLRHDEATGEAAFLCGVVPRYDYPLIEYHDCAEEAFVLQGDIRLGNSGLMVRGTYFWRPAYVTHGPFYSREGLVAYISVDAPLVNHYVDDPRRTVEENRAEALAQGPPPDHL